MEGESTIYVRFVTNRIDGSSLKRQGVFQAAADLIDSKLLPDDEAKELKELERWFDKNLRKPDRFARSRRSHPAPKAISWFKSSAMEYVERMHAMCRILNEHGVQTEMITSQRPGYVVFQDEFQIAAVPFRETAT